MARYRVRLQFVDPEGLNDRTEITAFRDFWDPQSGSTTVPVDSIVDEHHPRVVDTGNEHQPLVIAIMMADWLFEAESRQDGWANGAELGTEDAGGEDLPFWVDVQRIDYDAVLQKEFYGTLVYHRGPVKL